MLAHNLLLVLLILGMSPLLAVAVLLLLLLLLLLDCHHRQLMALASCLVSARLCGRHKGLHFKGGRTLVGSFGSSSSSSTCGRKRRRGAHKTIACSGAVPVQLSGRQGKLPLRGVRRCGATGRQGHHRADSLGRRRMSGRCSRSLLRRGASA